MSDTRYLGNPIHKPAPNKRKVLLIVGGGIGAIGVWYWFQGRNAGATDTTATDASIDPATGVPYASEYASGDDGSSPALGSYIDPSTGATITGGGSNNVVVRPSNNAEWVQQAVAYLVQSGFDPVAVTMALGKYISNKNLTDTELSIVQSALAAEGQPPVPPPSPHVAPPSGQGGGTTGGNPKTPTGLKVVSKSKNNAVLGWNASPGATGYRLKRNGVVQRTSKYNSVDVHNNGNWRVAATHGTFTSPYSAPIEVKGI